MELPLLSMTTWTHPMALNSFNVTGLWGNFGKIRFGARLQCFEAPTGISDQNNHINQNNRERHNCWQILKRVQLFVYFFQLAHW